MQVKLTTKAALSARTEPSKPQQHFVAAALNQQTQHYQTAQPMAVTQTSVYSYHFGPSTNASASAHAADHRHPLRPSSVSSSTSTCTSNSNSPVVGSGGVSSIYHRPVLSMPPVLLMGGQKSPIIEMPPSPAPIVEYPEEDANNGHEIEPEEEEEEDDEEDAVVKDLDEDDDKRKGRRRILTDENDYVQVTFSSGRSHTHAANYSIEV